VIQIMLVQLAARVVGRFVDSDEDGQGLAEYALILALIAIVAIVALLFLGQQISDKLSVIGDTISDP
jgi:pilus assembly protein Flp/PilA